MNGVGSSEEKKEKKTRGRGHACIWIFLYVHIYVCSYERRGLKGQREGMKEACGWGGWVCEGG